MAISDVGSATVGRLGDDVRTFYLAVAPNVEKMARVATRLAGVDDRDDVVQDALLQAWRARAQFDPNKGTLSAWLLAITAHQPTKARRRLAIRLSRPTPDRTDPDDGIDVREAVRHLSPRERLAVDCFYFADLSVADTAAVRSVASLRYCWIHEDAALSGAGSSRLGRHCAVRPRLMSPARSSTLRCFETA